MMVSMDVNDWTQRFMNMNDCFGKCLCGWELVILNILTQDPLQESKFNKFWVKCSVSKASLKKVKVLVHPGPHEITLFAAIYIASQLNEIYIAFILLIGGWVF